MKWCLKIKYNKKNENHKEGEGYKILVYHMEG